MSLQKTEFLMERHDANDDGKVLQCQEDADDAPEDRFGNVGKVMGSMKCGNSRLFGRELS